MEGPNQKTDDGRTELEELPNVSTDNNQENNRHKYTKEKEKEKTEERKADEALIAFKWKNQMIARYMSRTDRSMNTEEVRTTRREKSDDYG